jgi:hypothetical protein
MGQGPLLGDPIGGKPGDLPTAKRTKAKAQTVGRGPDTTLSAAAYQRERPQRTNLSSSSCRCVCFIYRAATVRNGISGVTRADGPDQRVIARRPGRLKRLACRHARVRSEPRLECSLQCGPEAGPEYGPAPEPHGHARGQQHERAPAQPNHSRSQVSCCADGDTEAAADREPRRNAHRTLRHQRQRYAGQRKCRRPTCLKQRPILTGGGWPRGSRTNGSVHIPPARAEGARGRVVRCHHACASSWQQAETFGASSYWSCRFTHPTILPSGSLRPLGVRSRK